MAWCFLNPQLQTPRNSLTYLKQTISISFQQEALQQPVPPIDISICVTNQTIISINPGASELRFATVTFCHSIDHSEDYQPIDIAVVNLDS